ncbi:MAG: 16S rRNA (cytidine(1402)-2'-O)-methyltransferase [Proteobacteria bacterium]|nr:16S rRNA (cytidine(1402)-2'-O)-methyltransferase [Pseudomonadota bacterium]
MPPRTDAKKKLQNRSSEAATSPDITDPRRHPATVQSFEGLAVVATPIGHSRDITLRALDILEQADVIACEDTRITAKLLAIHGISRPLLAYHQHNADRMRPALIKRLKGGETVALVSDAGTPLVSDPGYKLVRACIVEGIAVTPLPGASSVMCALVVSGLPTNHFFFAGFLPQKSAARKRALQELAAIPGSLVFLESAKRLAASLADMAAVLGDRDAAMTRELTKMFEEVRRGPLGELAAHYQSAGPPKGEVTIVVAPPDQAQAMEDDELDRLLGEALKDASVRDAADTVAVISGLSRRKVYTRALALKKAASE